MRSNLILFATTAGLLFSAIAYEPHALPSGKTAYDMAAKVVDIGAQALERDDGGPKWQQLERRLQRLFADKTREADEAVVILMSFYLGEHNGEELEENLLDRGPRMIPIIDRYLHEEPSSLLEKYPKRVRLERTTTVMFLKEDLAILRVRAGARRVARASIETAPLRVQGGRCTPKLVKFPMIKAGEELVRLGESYVGAPVLRAEIQESGDVTNLQLLSRSGIQRIDSRLLAANQWKYAPRPQCGVLQANIVVNVDWMAPE